MCDFEKHGEKIFSIVETIFFLLAIIITVFSCLLLSKINKSEQLKIKVNFDSLTNKENILLNYLKDEIENNTTNIYEKFFEKYNLTKEDTLGKNEKLLSCFKMLYKLDIAIIALVLFCFCFTLYIMIRFIITSIKKDRFYPVYYVTFSHYLSFLRCIIFFILFGVLLGFFINYKIKFQDDFFNFYSSINNNSEQVLFKEYYYSLFDLKNYFIIIIVFLPFCSLFDVGYIILHHFSIDSRRCRK